MSKILLFIKQTDIYFLMPIFISMAAILLLIFSFAVFFNLLPDKIPLFYSLSWGENQLTRKEQFLILPGLIFFIFVINLITAWQLHIQQLFLKRMLILSIIPLSLIILITGLKIIKIFI